MNLVPLGIDPPGRGGSRNSRQPLDPNRCPQCWIVRTPEAFVGKRGTRVRWCTTCRDRLTGGNRAADLAPLPCKVPALRELRARLVVRSHSHKLGGIPSSITSRGTCPPSCGFYGQGCYAEVHVLGYHWRRVSTGEQGDPWEVFCRQVADLPPGQLWRHNTAGDLPGQGERVDDRALRMLVEANAGKRGFTFSHKHTAKALAAIRWANDHGFTVNLSADSLAQADELAETGAGPVATVVPSTTPDAGLRTPAGRKVIVCPAQKIDGNDTTCATCRLCAIPTRKAIVAFRAHGVCASRVDRLVRSAGPDSLAPKRRLMLVPPPPPAPDVADEDEEDGASRRQNTRLTQDDLDEAERFGELAGALVLAGVRPVVAWAAANEWMEENPGALLPEWARPAVPLRAVEGRAAAMPAPRFVGLLATPEDRRRPELPAKAVEYLVPDELPVDLDEDLAQPLFGAVTYDDVPKAPTSEAAPRSRSVQKRLAVQRAPAAPKAAERIYAGCTHPEENHVTGVCYRCGCERFRPKLTREERAALREDREAVAPCPAVSPRALRPCGKPAVYGDFCVVHGMRAARGIDVRRAPIVHRDLKPGNTTKERTTMSTPMSDKTIEMRGRILGVLKDQGPIAPREVAEILGEDGPTLRYAMVTLVKDGEAEVRGKAKGSRWLIAGEASATARAAKPTSKKNGRANGKGNGHAAPVSSDPVQGALAALAAALTAKHEQATADFQAKLAALQVLAK